MKIMILFIAVLMLFATGCDTELGHSDDDDHDHDGDGVQDTIDEPMPGVTVRLLGADGTEIATTTTNSSGVYGFNGYSPAYYTVQVDTSTLPAGVAFLAWLISRLTISTTESLTVRKTFRIRLLSLRQNPG